MSSLKNSIWPSFPTKTATLRHFRQSASTQPRPKADVNDCLNISQQLLHRDWQVSNALTRRVIDCVGNRRRYRYRRQLAKALGAQGARFFIEAAYEQDIELRNIGIGWDEIAGVVAVDELARRRISFGLFQQRLAHAPDDAADRLGSRRLRIDDPTGVIGTDEAVQAHESSLSVDAHLGKDGGEPEDCLGAV